MIRHWQGLSLSPHDQLVGTELLLLLYYQLQQGLPCLVAEAALYQ